MLESKQMADKLSTLVTSAFGLVAALAWNNAIQTLFKNALGTPDNLSAQLWYAIIVTVIAVFATTWIAGIASRATKK